MGLFWVVMGLFCLFVGGGGFIWVVVSHCGWWLVLARIITHFSAMFLSKLNVFANQWELLWSRTTEKRSFLMEEEDGWKKRNRHTKLTFKI